MPLLLLYEQQAFGVMQRKACSDLVLCKVSL